MGIYIAAQQFEEMQSSFDNCQLFASQYFLPSEHKPMR